MHHDIPPLLAVAAGKRPMVFSGDEEESDGDEPAEIDKGRVSLSPDLPDTQHRVLGRMRKKSRLLDGYIT